MVLYFMTFKKKNVSKPGTGIALCIEKALALSGVAREDVNYINAHAASTPIADLKEYQAITRCFGNNPNVRRKLLMHVSLVIKQLDFHFVVINIF